MAASGPNRFSSGAGVEVAPLSQRVAAMTAFRLAQLAVLATLAGVHGHLNGGDAGLAIAYLVVTMLLSLLVLTPVRSVAVNGFGAALLIDGAFLQMAHERLGHGPAVDAVLAAQLVAVCLLASFRTGLKLAVWQSVLMVFAWRAEQTGLLPEPAAMAAVAREATTGTDMALLWLIVLTTSVAASINERELRRRRYDAEALERLATALLQDEQPRDVAARLVGFVISELGVKRAAVIQRTDGEQGAIQVIAGAGLTAVSGRWGNDSALLNLASTAPGVVRALQLDPRRDRALCAMMPQARRIAAIPLRLAENGVHVALVAEFGGRGPRGNQVERRTVSSAGQAAATATIAMSRAQLLAADRRAAITDGLTGLANRRFFDETMRAAERAWREDGIPFALVLSDVDHFKSVNDRHGHQVGDHVLMVVARVFADHAVGGSVAARYGGEEFALVIPAADTGTAAGLAERMRRAVREITEPVSVTASFGVAAVPEDASGVDEVILAADAALLRAKARGRDRVVMSQPTVSSPD